MNHAAQDALIFAGHCASSLVREHVIGTEHLAPSHLLPLLRRAKRLVVLDMPAFPFELLEPAHWELPLAVKLPDEESAERLIAAYGDLVFRHITFLDQIVCDDTLVWETLARRYSWAEGQRYLEGSAGSQALIERLLLADRQTTGYQGAAAAMVCCDGAGALPYDGATYLARGKAIHHLQARLLSKMFDRYLANGTVGRRQHVLEVGCGEGRWSSLLLIRNVAYRGVDTDAGRLAAARDNFRHYDFDVLGDDFTLPVDDRSCELVFTVHALHSHAAEVKRKLLSEMFRAAAPGAYLAYLEQFVPPAGGGETTVSVNAFQQMLWDVSLGRIVLAHMETVQYPDDPLIRHGLLVYQVIIR